MLGATAVLTPDVHRIVTHAGCAHDDDMLAVMVALAAYPQVAVVQRASRVLPIWLEDPAVLVLDTGGQHTPELRNFDHHQLRGTEDCAFSLLLRYLGLYDAAWQLYPWLGRLCHSDNYGPQSWGARHGIPASVLSTFACPVSSALRTYFSTKGTMLCQDPLFQVFRAMGQELHSTMSQLGARKAALRAQMRVYPSDSGHLLLQLPSSSRETTQISAQLLRERSDGWRVVLCIAPGRGSEIQIYRFPRAKDILPDIRTIFPDAEVQHASGFHCVYADRDINEVREKALTALSALPKA